MLSVIRRQFGAEIKTLRERAKLTPEMVSQRLRNTSATVRRWERGEALPRFSELEQMFDLYHVGEPEYRTVLLGLHEQNDSDLWHSKLKLPEATSRMRGFEAFATGVDLFDLWLIPGPFQTEAYADAVLRLLHPRLPDEDIKRLVELRVHRQQRVYKVAQPPTVRAVLTENALRPLTGHSDHVRLMEEQMRYLYSGPFGSKLRVLAADNRPHEGMKGSFTVFSYGATDLAGVYAEGPVRNLYTDDSDSVDQARTVFQRLWSAALTERESSERILSALKGL